MKHAVILSILLVSTSYCGNSINLGLLPMHAVHSTAQHTHCPSVDPVQWRSVPGPGDRCGGVTSTSMPRRLRKSAFEAVLPLDTSNEERLSTGCVLACGFFTRATTTYPPALLATVSVSKEGGSIIISHLSTAEKGKQRQVGELDTQQERDMSMR